MTSVVSGKTTASKFVPFQEAVGIVRERLKISFGKARALLRGACASEIRSFAKWHGVEQASEPEPKEVPHALWKADLNEVLYITDDGILIDKRQQRRSILPGRVPVIVDHSPVYIVRDDLMEWLREQATAPDNKTPSLAQAPDAEIRRAVRDVYDDADASKTKPPNTKEVAAPVLKKLAARGYITSEGRVMEIAGDDEFGTRRWRPGRPRRK